jgi:protein arginine kinase activator
MKCESCHKAEATVQVKQVADGMVKEVFLCAECAENSGLKSPAAMADFLFGMSSAMGGAKPAQDEKRRCPECDMSGSEFNKNNRLGCESCYETFAIELLPMIDEMHRAVKHIGKVPAQESFRAEIETLKADLIKAVKCQDFESAAVIRDRIKELEQA